jgi:hypothetical protein
MHPAYDDTVAALQEVVADCRSRPCRAGYFAALYCRTTMAVRRRAEAGRFEDPERMGAFVAAFADRYLVAYRAWRAGRPTSASWATAFEACGSPRPIVLQHLMLGMNAHIGFDLAITAAELAGSPAALAALRADFDEINDVLAGELDACQGAVGRVSPLLRVADVLGLRADEGIARFSFRLARGQAWEDAEHLVAAPPHDRELLLQRRDAEVARNGRRVRHPGLVLDTALLAVGAAERAAVEQVIDQLTVFETV